MVLVYSSGEISVRKLADSLPVYVEVKSEYETSFFDEEDDTSCSGIISTQPQSIDIIQSQTRELVKSFIFRRILSFRS